jgi:outer membrane receptor for ferrienterochelin and colicin
MYVRADRWSRLAALWLLVLLVAAPAFAQTPSATISGRVTDAAGLPVKDATVTASSPNLQGTRTAKTEENGTYTIPGLPPGLYTITVEFAGFATAREQRTLAAGEASAMSVALKPATVTEAVTVTGNTDTFVNSVASATSIKSELLAELPTARTLLSAVNLTSGAHATGPSGNITIGGAMSFENLFLLNGVQIQDNVRRTPFNLFIEDAIQETTVTTSGVSAEYGRFSGGVVNAVTKSGGNTYSGSFRTTVTNDSWRTTSPFDEPKTNATVPIYEYTVGGPIFRDRTWFFLAGRMFDQEAAQQLGFTDLPYVSTIDEDRFEAKVTQSIKGQHTIRGGYTLIRRTEANNAWPEPAAIMDTNSLVTRQLPQDLFSASYSGVYGSRLFVEAQYSARGFQFQNDGARSTDLILGTTLQDQQTGARWWSPTFCGVCVPEERDNTNFFTKATYFLATNRGSHNMVFGYDTFNDRRKGDNHQSGSDYHVWSTSSLIDNGTVYPIVTDDDNTWIIWWPIREASRGTNFRTHSLFVNDSWQYNPHFTFNLGLRYDKNDGKDAIGNLVANDSAWSPRLGVVWDPKGTGDWSINASYGHYVSAIANTIADSSSPAGTPAIFAYFYEGPEYNTGAGPLVPTDDALRGIFTWFNNNGGTNRSPFFVDIPGLATQIRESLKSTQAREFAVGVSKRLGARGAMRVDFMRRTFHDFYTDRVDTTTGTVEDEFGQVFDLKLVENTDALQRDYVAGTVHATYRFGSRYLLGGNYTLSRLHGNVNGETIGSGPVTSTILSYPEYFDPAWSSPVGDLAGDQRHRARIWGTFDMPEIPVVGILTVGLLEQIESGTPYGAIGNVRTGAFVPNPGYQTPPDTVFYHFTPRDEFHTETMMRTDLSVNWDMPLPGTQRAQLFANFHVLNLFNQFQLFNNSGAAINTTVLTAVEDPDRFATFNPFTETPVQGTHWDYGPDFGQAIGAAAYTLPRTFRFSFGVRF